MSNAAELFNQVQGRLYNPKKEKEILGQLINSPGDQIEIITALKPEHFVGNNTQALYSMALELVSGNYDLTYNVLCDHIELKAKSAQNARELRECLNEVRTERVSDTVFNSVSMLKELLRNRKIYNEVLIRGDQMFRANIPIEEIVNQISKVIVSIDDGRKEKDIQQVVDNVIDAILNPQDHDRGLETGLRDIDIQFGGIRKDRYYAVGAESGAGKTAFVVDIIERLCVRHSDKIKILFFSKEMSEERVIKRLISRKTGFTNDQLDGRPKPLSQEHKKLVRETRDVIKRYPLEIVYDTMNVQQMKLRAKKFALENPDKHLIIILDHIGLVVGETNDQRVNTINASSMMKSFCRDYGVSSIVLTQFTKEIDNLDNRKNFHRPHMGYIMESGRIRQDADAVWLLWRPETRFERIAYCNDPEWPTKGKMIILNEKNRDGQCPTDMIFDQDVGTNRIIDLLEIIQQAA